MLNKFYKTIHKKYSTFFNFIFFLRYLLLIFVVSITLFLNIPKFFDYKKKTEAINDFLLTNYNYQIANFEETRFTVFPIPKLIFKNVEIDQELISKKLFVKNLKIYPKLLSIYNYKNFKADKITFEDSNIYLDVSNSNTFIKKIFNQKNKLFFDNTDIQVLDGKKLLFKLENIKFANYGYKKNLIIGEIFEKKFKTEISNDYKDFKFKILNTGITADINLYFNNNSDYISGIIKSKILNSNLKFNFDYNKEKLKIYKSYFRNKDLSFNNEALIFYKPFLEINSKFNIDELNADIFSKINIENIPKFAGLIKKINGKNEINFKSKNFSRNLINELNLNFDVAYGRINYKKKIILLDSKLQCNGDINILEEYPLVFFNCKMFSDNKKNFLKKLSIKTKDKNEVFNLNFKGNLNILSKKINFESILIDKNYKASKEDLSYFKKSFENILFDETFTEIFDLKKIKEFVLEIS